MLGTFPLAEVWHGIDQWVSPEGRQLLVVLRVLVAQGHLALEARLDRRLRVPAATVAGDFEDQGSLLEKSCVVYASMRGQVYSAKKTKTKTKKLGSVPPPAPPSSSRSPAPSSARGQDRQRGKRRSAQFNCVWSGSVCLGRKGAADRSTSRKERLEIRASMTNLPFYYHTTRLCVIYVGQSATTRQ